MKRYLLIAGDNQYPNAGTDDWIACYKSYEEAKDQVKEIIKNGKTLYEINNGRYDREYDWFDIVDLDDWIW